MTIAGVPNPYYSSGGIYVDTSATLDIRDSKILNNQAHYDGGTETYSGGGIYNKGTLTVTNSVIAANQATHYGGGIFNGGTLTVVNSTIAGNQAGSWGGGIFSLGSATVRNSIVSLNMAPSNSDIFEFAPPSSARNLISAPSLLISFVQDPLPGYPGDLHVVSPSAAINTGSSNALAIDAQGNPLLTDLDGNPRIVNGTVDIGAYEFHPSEAETLAPATPSEEAIVIGPRLAAPGGTARRLIQPATHRAALADEGLFGRAETSIHADVVDSLVRQSLIYGIASDESALDVALATECGPQTEPAILGRSVFDKLPWSHTLTRRQTHRHNGAVCDNAVLAIDFLLADQTK